MLAGANSKVRYQCPPLHTCRHLYSIDNQTKMSRQPSFYETTASGGEHPPTACIGQNLSHLPVSRPAMRSGDAA
jgi:hypothetical protein